MANLPPWLTRREDGVFVVDPDLAYPAIFSSLGLAEDDIDQYWIEVAYQCAKLHVQNIWRALEPNASLPLQIHILAGGGRKERWALKEHRVGRGTTAATQGGEARAHYARIQHLLGV
ncbi:MAG TPA: hypothetical protein VNK48_07320 [Xanthobacteraceae bacterium]|nr:hypothetical protein [Xanthobacteraceae bacterium]